MSADNEPASAPENWNKENRTKNILSLRQALTLVWESAPWLTLASAVLIVAQGILPLVTLYLLKLIIDAVTAGQSSGGIENPFYGVVVLIIIFSAIILLTFLTRTLSVYVNESQAAQTTDHIQNILHAKSVEVDLEYYENPAYYDTLYLAQQEATVRPTRIVNGLFLVGQSGIALLTLLFVLISFSWLMVLLLAIAVIPAAVVRWKYASRIYQWRNSRTSKERQAYYFHWMLTDEHHAKEIRLFNLGSRFMDRHRNLRNQLRTEYLKILEKRMVADSFAQILSVLALFFSFVFIAYNTLQGIITLGDLVLYFGAIQQSQLFMNNLLTGMAGLYEDTIFLSSLHDFLELKPKVKDPVHPIPVPVPLKQGISFDHVTFRYPGSPSDALTDINLTLSPGKIIALVGENGSGKTTLVKLLCRLYDPESGNITIDDFNIRDMKILDLRREISIIFQDYARYNLTAKENILFGSGDRPVGDDRIYQAAESAGADLVINRLENQYETLLGKLFDSGTELSIGEWQKIALARAFIRDAQIIIMDEPTSALDPLAEAEVIAKLQTIAKGRAALIISHRLSSVKATDCIYFMEGGRIIESGKHDDLIALGGKYYHFFETQARQYR
jgi:ATP-binding cassette, subfamily B, bacterial